MSREIGTSSHFSFDVDCLFLGVPFYEGFSFTITLIEMVSNAMKQISACLMV